MAWAKANPERRRAIARKYNRKRAKATKDSLINSATWKGRRAELHTMNVLGNCTDNNESGMNKSFDLFWEGKRVDVKSCNLYARPGKKKGKWWVFNKNKGEADYYFCIGLVDDKPVKYWMIPAPAFGKSTTIGFIKSKYEKYVHIPSKGSVPRYSKIRTESLGL
jgi:hypothetical protein